MLPNDSRHGTNAGYIAHRRAGESACVFCLAGRARFEKRRRVDAQRGFARTVPSIGTQRRINALRALGWSFRRIATEAGYPAMQNLQYAMRNETCNRTTWLRVAEAYERLCMTVPPPSSGATRTRLHAARRGWAPPLAWDDIDDPNEQPGTTKRSVGRPPRKEDVLQDFEWLTSQGVSDEHAAARVGVKLATIRDYQRQAVAA